MSDQAKAEAIELQKQLMEALPRQAVLRPYVVGGLPRRSRGDA